MAKPRKPSATIVDLARTWIAEGFLDYVSAARKNRSYRLGERYRRLIE